MSAVRNVVAILFVAIAIALMATLGTTLSYDGIFCDPPFAFVPLVRWFAFFAASVGSWIALAVIILLLAIWRMQHTFVQTMWTRRVLAVALGVALLAGAAPPFFITPAARAVCR